jgi:uncharacterized protein (DUF111 family)
MNLTLNQKEQIEAVENYLKMKGFNVSEYDISVKTVAGRGNSGARIEVELNDKLEEKVNHEVNANYSNVEDTVENEEPNIQEENKESSETEVTECEKTASTFFLKSPAVEVEED